MLTWNCTLFIRKSAGVAKQSNNKASTVVRPFHLAIPVHSVPLARNFYGNILGCVEGRRDGNRWQDYNLFGHQLVCHFVGAKYRHLDYRNPVDKHEVPVPHFGLCFTVAEFHALAKRLKRHPNDIKFLISPYLRFRGQPGEQWTMFFKDPSGNNLECKAMTNPKNLFAKYDVKK